MVGQADLLQPDGDGPVVESQAELHQAGGGGLGSDSQETFNQAVQAESSDSILQGQSRIYMIMDGGLVDNSQSPCYISKQ